MHNIVGIGASRKQVAGQMIEAPAVTLFVRRKRVRGRLAESERIPEVLRLESIEADVVTDVVEVGSTPVAHASKERPLRPGCGGAHFLGEEGTFGLFVRRVGQNEPLVLSCSHVLARSGLASPDDVVEQPLGGAAITDPVAKLTDVFSVLSTSSVNTEDIALARIDDGIKTNLLPLPSDTPITSVSDLRAHQFAAGIPTRLLGLTTPDGRGATLTSEASFRVRELPGVGDVTFSGLVAYVTPCAGGDSGAVVVTDDGATALGLHIGGTPTGLGVFLPLGPVFSTHGLELL
jgi:hypothetical protein